MNAEIRALVAPVLIPRARAKLDELAIAPLLSADIAGMIRALADRELLALCAPELRRRLDLAGRPFPAPSRRERLLRKLRKTRVLRRHERRPARWRNSEPAPAPPTPEDLGPLGDDLSQAELDAIAVEVFAPLLDPEPEDDAPLTASMAAEEIRERVGLEPGLPRRLPVLAPELAPPIVLRPAAPPAPAHLQALPVHLLDRPAQLFRCVPLASTIPAHTCVDRQRQAAVTVGSVSRVNNEKRALAARFSRCKSCDLGRAVAAQIRRAS